MNGYDFDQILQQKINGKNLNDYNFMMKNKDLLMKHSQEISNKTYRNWDDY
ncbi:hypothetical protein pb186bvf_000406 [Paramecium bursaria]